ncbi:hypothetical protein ACJMK2_003342 [Sinanodonta woodiana]|uniref:Sushi domain-containing protein n=1 Tax=Sinanodonta woodiana TaxID=1069815 RepID=A0ABD3XY00_SINWO
MLSYSSSSTINVISPEGKQRILVKGLDYPYGLVVYPSKGRMFYTESQGKSHVGQASMDGSQSTVVLDLSNDWPRDLVIDYRTDNLYWIDYWDDSIEVCKLDGTNRKRLFKLTDDTSISGLALYKDYIFISTLEHSHMLQLKISNPNETSIFATVKELGTIQGINIYSSTNENRNKLCSSVNGGCSTFCFPTPDASVCGCEEGVDLKKGNNKECSNMHVCNDTIPNGYLQINCTLDIGSTCSYYCDEPFSKNPSISNIQCKEDGQWNADLNVLCKKANAPCPNTFPGGGWDNCLYRVNETCTYTCFPGYHKNPQIMNATCGVDGAWNQNIEKMCTRKCDLSFNNASIDSSCALDIGDVCNFQCEYGYKVTSGVSTVTCQENGSWAPNKPCEEIFCPTTIPNGTINETMCNKRIYSVCTFMCNQGFDVNPKHSEVFCEMDGTWEEADTPYCLERKGLCKNFFENGKWAENCNFRADETCAFECNPGFNRNPNITHNITCTSSAEWNIDLRVICIENDRGLIVTIFEANNQHISTVAIDSDGTPRLDNMPSSYFPIDAEILSIQGDYTLHQAYTYDRYTQSIYRDSNFSIGLSRNNIWTTLHRGLSKDHVKLAVDWISHNIYWTDPQYKWIVVQSLLGNDTSMHRVLIHDNLDRPQALALDPFQALLFWSDVGKFTNIEVSSLSGSNRKILAFSNLLHPYSITADCAYQQLYFIDVGRQTLETVSYEGKDRKVVFKKTYSYFFEVAVFKDYLYVTDTKYDKLYFVNKTDGKELQTSLSKDGVTYFGVTVFHPDAQNAPAKAHCVSYGCDHICVTKKDGATCLCKDGYTLNQDMRTCSLSSEFFHRGLMFSNKSSICIVDIRVVTHFSYNPNCVLKIINTLYMVLDTDDREIILANNTGVYSARVDDFQLRLMTELSGTISGLAWDGYDRILYWTENNTGRIWRLSRESETAQVFLEDLKNPRDILILPHERLVYWISDRNGSTIESSRMDRSNHQIVLNSADLVNPRSLSYDPQTKRIYFLSNSSVGRNYIRYCHLNGSRLVTFVSTNKHLENLEIYKGHLLVTAKDDLGTLIMSYSIDMWRLTTSGIFENTGNITAIKVFDENFRQNETGPCFALNGDCEQICISKGKSRICECTFGFRLSANGKTCTSDPINDNFMIVIDYTYNYIYQINLTDQSVQGINVQGNFPQRGLTYSHVSGQVIWGTDDSEISMMYLNGTGKKLLPLPTKDNDNITPIQFAVDYSTGNIYYTGFRGQNAFKFESFIGIISPDGKHRVLITGLDEPHGLVVYPSKGLLFYTNKGFNSHLGQANMDGSQSAVLIDIANTWPSDLTVDYKSDYLYWTRFSGDRVEYCKLDGTNYNTLITFQDTVLNGIAVFQDYLFISTDGHSDNIIQLKISNPNETVAFASHGELGTIGFIEIYSSAVLNRNTFCSVNNGGCSTFCFPVPGGGICGCEDGVDLKEGSKTVCSNIPYCPEISRDISVSTDCSRANGSKCNFTCALGYKPKPGVDIVLCNGDRYIPEEPCMEIKCPGTFANGRWVNCTFSIGTSCNYTCNYGYTKNELVAQAECQGNGNWKLANTDALCKPVTCPKDFHQGKIKSTCERRIGQRCDYECTGYGYKKNKNISNIECMQSGTWNSDTNILCQQITCPKEIPNGVLLNDSNGQQCSTALGTRCGFACNNGFVKPITVNNLHCLLDGWAEDLQFLCTVQKAMSAGLQSEVHPAAIAVGVVVGVSMIIVITLIIWRRRSMMSQFGMRKLQEDQMSVPDTRMSARFDAEDDGVYFQADYDNCIDRITESTNRE